MVTVGRVLFASIQRWFPTHRTYHVLPFVLAGAFVVIAALPDGSTVGGILAFGLAGLGCSALLPLTISFAQEDLVSMSAATAGLVIAAYQLGYGIAAFGAGPLQDAGVTLPDPVRDRRRGRRRVGDPLVRHRPPGTRGHGDPPKAVTISIAVLTSEFVSTRGATRRG